MQIILVDLAGEVEDAVEIVLDAYDLRDVSLLTVAPVGPDIFPHRLEWLILTQMRRVFTLEDYLLTRQPRSERVLGQYNNIRVLVSGERNVNIGL